MKTWLRYVKPYWKYFISGPLCMIIEVVGEMFMPLFMAMVMDNAENKGIGYCIGVTALMISMPSAGSRRANSRKEWRMSSISLKKSR